MAQTTSTPAEVKEKPAKAKAKPSPAPTPKAKETAPTAKPEPAKAPSKAPAKAKPEAETDEWGLKVGSLNSKAVAMYASKGGATVGEVKQALGTLVLNVLTKLQSEGHSVKRVKEKGAGPRQVTRYFLSR